MYIDKQQIKGRQMFIACLCIDLITNETIYIE